MKKVTTHEAKTHLSKLIEDIENGEEVLIHRGKIPVAKLVPVNENVVPHKKPKTGTHTSDKVSYSEDAFEPLDNTDLVEWGLS